MLFHVPLVLLQKFFMKELVVNVLEIVHHVDLLPVVLVSSEPVMNVIMVTT
jgi:hypothetical protein